jgi:hypothetical protein
MKFTLISVTFAIPSLVYAAPMPGGGEYHRSHLDNMRLINDSFQNPQNPQTYERPSVEEAPDEGEGSAMAPPLNYGTTLYINLFVNTHTPFPIRPTSST